jgi:hypothetical protein
MNKNINKDMEGCDRGIFSGKKLNVDVVNHFRP